MGRQPNLANYVDQIASSPELLALLQQRLADASKPIGETLFDEATDAQYDRIETLIVAAHEAGKTVTDKIPQSRGMADAFIGALERALGITQGPSSSSASGRRGNYRKGGYKPEVSQANVDAPPTSKQLWKLESLGYAGPAPATRKQASELIASLLEGAAVPASNGGDDVPQF